MLVSVAPVVLILLCYTSFDSAKFLVLLGSPALVSAVDLPLDAPELFRPRIEDI